MVIDTSAVMAILMGEPDAAIFAQAISVDFVRLMSAATLLEAAIVIESRYGNAGNEKLDEFIAEAQIMIEPVTGDQITVARIAFRTYRLSHVWQRPSSVIAFPMPWQNRPGNLCCTRATIL
jgi:ribonuclease VapC